MLTATALALSLFASNLASADPGAGASAPASAGASTPASEGAPARGDAIVGIPTIGTSTIGTQNIGMPTIGTPIIGTQTNSEARGFPTGSLIPLCGFVLCGAAAVFFAKRKQLGGPKLLEIVETHALGSKRALIVARIAGETVLLGSSEGGLTLLLARPGETVLEQAASLASAARQAPRESLQAAPGAAGSASGALRNSWLGKLRLARTHEEERAPEPSFEELLEQDAAARAASRARVPAAEAEPALLRQPLDPLAESAEDQELRRKLAAGRSGRIA